jgi:hypothetical protein
MDENFRCGCECGALCVSSSAVERWPCDEAPGAGKAGFIGSRPVRRLVVGQGHRVLKTIAEHVLSVVGKPEAFFDMSRVVHATTGALPRIMISSIEWVSTPGSLSRSSEPR